METDEEFTKLKMELEIFPNFFQLDSTVKRNAWQNVKNKLLSEREETFDDQSPMEKHRDLNLEAYANFELEDTDKAEKLIAGVLAKSKNANMNACAMMTRIKYLKGKFTESKQLLEHLKELMKDQHKVYQAKAELAYAYTRLEARYYAKAINILEEVVTMYPDEFIWKYGLVLPYRRCIHLSVRTLLPELDVKHYFKRAKELLQNIIDDCKLPLYVARAYIEMANLYLSSQLIHELSFLNVKTNTIVELINDGVRKAPNIHGILARAGRNLRHVYKFDDAKTYLESAIKIRRTSFVCHQLGLVMIGKIKNSCKRRHPKQKLANEETPVFHNNYLRSRSGSSQEQASINQLSSGDRGGDSEIDLSMNSSPGLLNKTHTKNENHLEEDSSIASNLHLISTETYNNVAVQGHTMTIDLPEKQTIPYSKQSQEISTTLASSQEQKTNGQSIPRNSFENLLIDDKLTNKDSETKTDWKSAISRVTISKSIDASKSMLSPYANVFVPSLVVQKKTNKQTLFFKSVLKSPNKIKPYPKSKSLTKCMKLFQEAFDKSEGKNMEAMYDLGITYLHITPPRYEKARECFIKIINIDNSPYMRYRSYEQSGVCLVYMSQLQNISETVKNEHVNDAMEMFKRAIRCWAQCQTVRLHTSPFNKPNEYCKSLISIKELILTEGSLGKENLNNMQDLAKLYTIVREYGHSLDLYQEVWEILKSHQGQDNEDIYIELIHGVIDNSMGVDKFDDALDLLTVLLYTKEGQKSKEFAYKALLKAIKYSIETNDVLLSNRVFKFDMGPRYRSAENTDDIIIIFDEGESVASDCGNKITCWLNTFCSELRVTKNSDNVSPNKPILCSQGEAMADAQMVIFVVTDCDKKREFEYHLMDVALTAYCDKAQCLSRIFPVCLDGIPLPKQLKPFKYSTLPDHPSDTNRILWLNTFCELYFRIL